METPKSILRQSNVSPLVVILLALSLFKFQVVWGQPHGKKAPMVRPIVVDLLDETLEESSLPPFDVNGDGAVIITLKNCNRFIYSVTVYENQVDGIVEHPISTVNTEFKNVTTNSRVGELLQSFSPPELVVDAGSKDLREAILNREGKIKDLAELDELASRSQDTLSKIDFLLQSYKALIADSIGLHNEIEVLSKSLRKGEKADSADKKIEIAIKEKEQLLAQVKTKLEQFLVLHGKVSKLESNRTSVLARIVEIGKSKVKVGTDIIAKNSEIQNLEVGGKRITKLAVQYQQAAGRYKASVDRLLDLELLYGSLLRILYDPHPIETKITQKLDLLEHTLGTVVFSSGQLDASANRYVSTSRSQFGEMEGIWNQILASDDKLKDGNFEAIKLAHERAKLLNSWIVGEEFSKFLASLSGLYDAIDESNFTKSISTMVIGDNVDYVDYKIVCTALEVLPSGIAPESKSFNYRVRIQKGVKLDVSTGLVFNFRLNNSEYRFDTIGTQRDSLRVVGDKASGHYLPSVVLMLNFYRRNYSTPCRLGGNIGISTKASGGINYYFGVAALIGKSQRVNFTGGVVGGQVDMPKPKYAVGTEFSANASDLPTEIPLQDPKPFRIGVYGGFTFNLTGAGTKSFFSQVTGN